MTVIVPATHLPGPAERLVDGAFRASSRLRTWMLQIDRAVRKFEGGVNSGSDDAAAAQATADAALPKAGGTMTGALIMSGATASLTIASMTTTQKNALTAADGMIVYDTTLGKFQGREAGAWVNLI